PPYNIMIAPKDSLNDSTQPTASDSSPNGGTPSMSADSSVGEAASFPSNNNRGPNSAPYSLPNSRKVYVNGKIYADIRVPFREISQAPTKLLSGDLERNEPVRVYDTSGPWGDPSVTLDPVQGLPPLRHDWIRARGD